MFRKIGVIITVVLSLILLAACNRAGSAAIEGIGKGVPGFATGEKEALLLHPLKDAVAMYGEDFVLTWEGDLVKLSYEKENCTFVAYVGAEFETYDYYNRPIDINDCDVMEYLNHVVIRKVIASDKEYVCEDRFLRTRGDDGRERLEEAVSFVNEKELATFSMDELTYQGGSYSSYYGAWFYGWQFTKGDYEGYELHVEQAAPYRIYVTSGETGFPILFWCNGEYVDPMVSFLGKWRDYNRLDYIEIKSISKEGIVIFDMYTEKGNSGEMVLLENLNTAINEVPQNLDVYLLYAYIDEALDGDTQFYNGEVQSGYYSYAGDKLYLTDSLVMNLDGMLQYYNRSMTGRVGPGTLPVHIPGLYDYTQDSTWGYMENFGRDDPNGENILKNGISGGEETIDQYLNKVHETSGLKYATLDYAYLYDYQFPVNDAVYHVWESKSAEDPHYLYVDSTNGMLIKETQRNLVSRYTKELIFKAGQTVNQRSYAYQKYLTPDGKITIDLVNRTIQNTDAFAQNIEISDVGYDTAGKNGRYMFFSEVGNRFVLNGYVLFDQASWGATLHITDSNLPDFPIGVYPLNSEQFFLDPSVAVVIIPEKEDEQQVIGEMELDRETRQVIRDFNGTILGYIYVDGKGDKTVKDFTGKILGYYYADRDVTTNFYGKILTRGDTASALLFDH